MTVGHRVLSTLAEVSGDAEMESLTRVRWLQVKSVVEDGISAVFDLEVEEHHNFVAQGLVVHNCVFQEQSMLLGTVVAGFDAAGRAKLRRAIGKKKADLMAEVGEAFLDGAGREFRDTDGGIISPVFSRRTAQRLWESLKRNADYQFNRSHSQAYGQVTFLTAYAKANWPSQAAAAVLACTDDDDKRRRVLADLRSDGIVVAPPDINLGRATTSVGADGRLRLGLSEIRDVGRAAGLILAERETRGVFVSLTDLMQRLEGQQVTVRVVEALVEAGALDAFGPRMGLMMSLRADLDTPIDAEWGGLERSERQRMRLGLRVGEHPLTPHREALRAYRSTDGAHEESGATMGRPARGVSSLLAMDLAGRGRSALVAGVLTRWDRSSTKAGTVARFDLEGSDGAWVEGTMWNDDLIAQERLGVPPVGSVVAVDGWAKRRTIEVRVSDDDSGGAGIDAGDGTDREETTRVEVTNLRADTLAAIELEDHHHVSLPPGRRFDLRSALHRSRVIVAADKAARRRKPARPRKATVPTPAGTTRCTDGRRRSGPVAPGCCPTGTAAGYSSAGAHSQVRSGDHPGPGCPPGG